MIQAVACLLIKGWYLLIGIGGIGFLIGFHELGHYLFARLFGVRAPSFSIGMGPKIASITKWGTNFSLSAIPLGGYVEIAGLAEAGQGEQSQARLRDQGTFPSKPYWQKFLILFGGILFNILFAYIALSGLFYIGIPQTVVNPEKDAPLIAQLVSHGAADAAGIKSGDLITQVNGLSVNSIEELKSMLTKSADTSIQISVKRGVEEKTFIVHVPQDKLIGISRFESSKTFAYGTSILDCIKRGFMTTNAIMISMAKKLAHLFKTGNGASLGGPLQIIASMSNDARQGIRPFMLIMILISLNLALLNLIPVPIFDGGQIVLTSIESIIGRELPEKVRMFIAYACWALVLALFVYLTINDLYQLFIKNLITHFIGK